jgi:hypothetical protein
MGRRRRTRLTLGGSGSQLPLDRLVDRGPPEGPANAEPTTLSETSSDAAMNARRARWLEERARFERAHPRPRPPENPAPEETH